MLSIGDFDLTGLNGWLVSLMLPIFAGLVALSFALVRVIVIGFECQRRCVLNFVTTTESSSSGLVLRKVPHGILSLLSAV